MKEMKVNVRESGHDVPIRIVCEVGDMFTVLDTGVTVSVVLVVIVPPGPLHVSE